jgi:prepilin-type N-terminal cleavage/methylation domain-containing protein
VARKRPQRGFTLIEVLVTVVLIGMVAVLAVTQINNAWQKSRLDSEVGNVRAFLQSAYTYMVNHRAPVYVRVQSQSGKPVTLSITQNADGTGTKFATMTMPDYITLSTSNTAPGQLDATTVWPAYPVTACPATNMATGGTGVLECDATGAAVVIPASPVVPPCTIPTMVTQVQRLVVTHVRMVGGSLRPKIVYTLQVTPLWSVQVTKAVWS